jgi:hypothetical protein
LPIVSRCLRRKPSSWLAQTLKKIRQFKKDNFY